MGTAHSSFHGTFDFYNFDFEINSFQFHTISVVVVHSKMQLEDFKDNPFFEGLNKTQKTHDGVGTSRLRNMSKTDG